MTIDSNPVARLDAGRLWGICRTVCRNLLLALVACVFLQSNAVQAQICTGSPGNAFGNASVLASNELELTPNAQNQAGSWWSAGRIDLTKSFDFTVNAYLGTSDAGGDGITFVLRNPSSGTLGTNGSWMGYGGISQSLAVEVDTQNTIANDPANDHVAVDSNGTIGHNIAAAAILANLEDGNYHAVRISWAPGPRRLQVYVDGTQQISVTVDIATIIGTSTAAWGFTGGTDTATNLQKVCMQSLPAQTLVAQADLSLTMSTSTTTPAYGSNFTYTLTLDSSGFSSTATATGVTVTDVLPAGLTFVSATAGMGSYDSSTGVWNVGSLVAGGGVTLTITAKANSAGATIVNTAQVTASSLPDPDSTPNNGVASEDDQVSQTITIGGITINCPTGSTATGSGYAASGSSSYVGQIFWMDWSCGATTTFPAGAIVSKSWTVGDGMTITGQISGSTKALQGYNVGSWSGDMLQLLHGGLNPIGLVNAVPGEDPTFNLAFSATLNGSPVSLRWVIGDGEDSGGSETTESIRATTNGSNWQIVETLGSISLTNTGSTATIYDPAAAGGGTAVLETSAANLTLGMTLYAGGNTAVAIGILTPYDFSDAPLTGTSYGAANHRTVPGLRLGAAVTTESVAYNSPTASADSDDGVTIPPLSRGQATTISVAVSGPGYLSGWIDFNGDGDFADAGEQVASNVVDGGAGDADGTVNGIIAVSVTPPVNAVLSATIARFRLSSNTGQASSGLAGFGEVEDYQFTLANTSLTVAKTSTAISDPKNGTTNPKAIPGATVRYCVSISNSGSVAASTVTLIDTLPPSITYVAGSLRSGTSCAAASTSEDDDNAGADESDPFGASASGGAISGIAPNLAAGATFALTYDVTVN